MYRDPYLKIATQLDVKLNLTSVTTVHGKLQFIAPYNNQFNSSELEHTLPKPAILIQFSDSDWKSKGKNQQEALTAIKFHVAQHNIADDNFYSADNTEALKIDAYMDLVHVALQGFSAIGLSALNRTRSYQDESHDHIFVHVMEYEAKISDCSADITQNYVDFNAILEVKEDVVPIITTSSPFIAKT